MKPLQFVGKDEPLNTMQGLTLRPSAIAIARRTFVGRKLFGRAVTFVPPETQTYQYSKLTEMSHARTDPKYPGKENLDILSEDVTPVNIPIHHKEFVIPKADLDASRMTGIPLNTKYSDAATYQVGLQEAYSLGFHSPESIIDLFRCLNDFDDSITRYQVNWFFTNKVDRNEVRPYSCRTIQRYGWCLGVDCPRSKRR